MLECSNIVNNNLETNLCHCCFDKIIEYKCKRCTYSFCHNCYTKINKYNKCIVCKFSLTNNLNQSFNEWIIKINSDGTLSDIENPNIEENDQENNNIQENILEVNLDNNRNINNGNQFNLRYRHLLNEDETNVIFCFIILFLLLLSLIQGFLLINCLDIVSEINKTSTNYINYDLFYNNFDTFQILQKLVSTVFLGFLIIVSYLFFCINFYNFIKYEILNKLNILKKSLIFIFLQLSKYFMDYLF